MNKKLYITFGLLAIATVAIAMIGLFFLDKDNQDQKKTDPITGQNIEERQTGAPYFETGPVISNLQILLERGLTVEQAGYLKDTIANYFTKVKPNKSIMLRIDPESFQKQIDSGVIKSQFKLFSEDDSQFMVKYSVETSNIITLDTITMTTSDGKKVIDVSS